MSETPVKYGNTWTSLGPLAIDKSKRSIRQVVRRRVQSIGLWDTKGESMSSDVISFDKFECDKCGACCESLIVEAYDYDACREPKLYQISNVDRQELRGGEQCIVLYDINTRACPFLDSETKHCSIYATRPVVCVMVEAGDAKCQQARQTKGLPVLRDRDGNEPSRKLLVESCEDYGLEPCEF